MTNDIVTDNDKLVEFLSVARSYVAKGWTQNSSALSAKGREVSPLGRAAVCWCAMGAITRAGDKLHTTGTYVQFFATRVLRLAALKTGALNIVAYNDKEGRTQEEVLALFDTVINELKKPRDAGVGL